MARSANRLLSRQLSVPARHARVVRTLMPRSSFLAPAMVPFAGGRCHHKMDESGRRRPKTARRAFTLLEVLLVLALLVAVAAMAAPVLSRTLDARQLRAAADDVRTEWIRTRNRAMESGRTFVFRYQPTSNAYTVEPWAREEDYLESSDLTLLGAAPAATAGILSIGSDPLAAGTINRQLPDGILFSGSDTAFDARAELMAQQTPTAALTDPQWSPPIFFYADGTSSTARLALSNERQQFVVISLRGMTGVIQVSGFLSAEELP